MSEKNAILCLFSFEFCALSLSYIYGYLTHLDILLNYYQRSTEVMHPRCMGEANSYHKKQKQNKKQIILCILPVLLPGGYLVLEYAFFIYLSFTGCSFNPFSSIQFTFRKPPRSQILTASHVSYNLLLILYIYIYIYYYKSPKTPM